MIVTLDLGEKAGITHAQVRGPPEICSSRSRSSADWISWRFSSRSILSAKGLDLDRLAAISLLRVDNLGREVLQVERFVAVGEDNGPFDDLLELPDVARPVERPQTAP